MKNNKRNKCCKTITLLLTFSSFAQQILFENEKDRGHSHPLADSPSSPLKKIFRNRETSNLSTHDTREHRRTLKREESCNELSEEALSIHPRYRVGKPATSSR